MRKVGGGKGGVNFGGKFFFQRSGKSTDCGESNECGMNAEFKSFEPSVSIIVRLRPFRRRVFTREILSVCRGNFFPRMNLQRR